MATRTHLDEIRQRLSSPRLRELLVRKRQLEDSSSMREMAKGLGWLRDVLAARPATAPKAKRKPGAGAKRKLTTEEVGQLQAAYKAAYRPGVRKPKQHDVFNELRKLLPKGKQDIGDSTLRENIVRPLRRNKPTR
jgi:hypothetical protein